MPGIHYFLLIILLGWASFSDLRRKVVPNYLTYGMTVTGLLLGFLLGGRVGFLNSLLGWAFGGGVFFFFWLMKAIGGGDVKLMAGVGAFLGWPHILDALFLTALCGGVMGLLFIIWKRRSKAETGEETVPVRKQTLPYGVAIAVGTILSMIL